MLGLYGNVPEAQMVVACGKSLKYCEMFSIISLIVGDAAVGKIFRSIIFVSDIGTFLLHY
jgi:hypothetical protein